MKTFLVILVLSPVWVPVLMFVLAWWLKPREPESTLEGWRYSSVMVRSRALGQRLAKARAERRALLAPSTRRR